MNLHTIVHLPLAELKSRKAEVMTALNAMPATELAPELYRALVSEKGYAADSKARTESIQRYDDEAKQD